MSFDFLTHLSQLDCKVINKSLLTGKSVTPVSIFNGCDAAAAALEVLGSKCIGNIVRILPYNNKFN